MAGCSQTAYEASDRLLTVTYDKLVKRLEAAPGARNAELLKRLVASQLAWRSYRDADSQLQGGAVGGPAEKSNVMGALYGMTVERVNMLDSLLNGLGL